MPVPSVLLIAEGDPPLAASLRVWAETHSWQLMLAGPQGAEALMSDPQIEVKAVVSLNVPFTVETVTPVVLVEVDGASPQANVSTVGEPGGRHDEAGFLAGVIVGLTSQTQWVGLVTESGSALEPQLLEGFDQGLRYGCPKCRLVQFPASEASVDGFRAQGVDVVFPVPGPSTAEVAAELGAAGLWIVWIGNPPESLPTASMAGRINLELEPLILAALEALLNGDAGSAWPYAIHNGGLVLAQLNDEAISPGRQRLVWEAYDSVATGELVIGTTGE
jgi:basic membrane lipoprotein Med (substrate-binding protein (PBP1-ABC) superfamily)